MKDFQYSLEKYTGINTRYQCPGCGNKKSFVRYLDNETGLHIADNVGRCNRENSCGYHYTPKEFFQNKGCRYSNYFQDTQEIEQLQTKPDYIPNEVVITSQSLNNCLLTFLKTHYSLEAIMDVAKKYCIGSTKTGETVFYQIDVNGKTRTGKIIKYNPQTGKRAKTMDWVHSRLIKLKILKSNFHLKQCLFGEHLLCKYPNMDIALVEGEKNAICGALIDPNKLWLAVGSKHELKPEKLLPLKGRKIILYPDADATEVWEIKAEELHSLGFNIKVSHIVSNKATAEQKQKGYGFFDFVMGDLQKAPH